MVITILFTVSGNVCLFVYVFKKTLVDDQRTLEKNENSCKSKQMTISGSSKKLDTLYTDAQMLTSFFLTNFLFPECKLMTD